MQALPTIIIEIYGPAQQEGRDAMTKTPFSGGRSAPPSTSGIPSEWTEAEAAVILNLVREKPNATLADIKQALKQRGLLKKKPRRPVR